VKIGKQTSHICKTVIHKMAADSS